MKKRLLSVALALLMCVSLLPVCAQEAAEVTPEVSFTDVPEGHAFYDAVMYLAKQGIINGKTETEFCPDDSLKREEFAKILSCSFGLSSTSGAPIFYDVPVGTWYATYVQHVAASKLMNGISETKFGTGMTLSRQDLALILKRFIDGQKIQLTTDNTVLYADNGDVADYAKEAVDALIASGIMPGRDDNMWHPQEDVTRAETAQALYNTLIIQKKIADSQGRYGDASQYDGPYDVPKDDRLAESMPTPFDANIWPRFEIIYEDFEDADYGVLEKGYFSEGLTIETTGGYGNNGGCIKLESGDTEGKTCSMVWTAYPEDLLAGDWLVMTCMVKGEGITCETGGYRSRVSIYDDKGKWLDETHKGNTRTDSDWFEMQQIIMVPEGVNELTTPDYYTINLHAHASGVEGTVWFDDFKLYKIQFDPMDTVLMTPNYKGIIKGEGGVGDIALRAYVNESNGMFDLSNMTYTAQITDDNHNVLMKTESDNVTSVMDVYFSSADLPMGGNYYLESILTYKDSGEQVQKQEWTLYKREKDFQTVVGYDEYGRVMYKGEPLLPVRMYNYTSYDDAVSDVINSGNIDDFMHTGMGWYYNFGTSEEYRNYIKQLEENDVTISLATGSMSFSNMITGEVSKRVKEQADIRGLLSKLVNNFKGLPNLFSYYIFDEQNAMRYGEELAWTRRTIETLDFDHPTTCAIDIPLPTRPGIYAKTSDFIGYDPYPVTGKETQNLSTIYDRISTGKKLNPNRPVYLITQNFWYDVRGDLRGPNQTEYRNMIFQGLTAGACMIDSWAYRWAKEKPNPGSTFEKDWADTTEVLEELKYLEPIILSVLPAPHYEIKGGGEWLNTMSKRHDGKSYLFTVNNEPAVKVAKIYLDGVKEIRGMYTDKVYEADDNGWFEIEWDSYEVEVFEYEQEDYKSSHAELLRFGLSDIVMTDSESEVSSFVIPKDVNEAEYNAKVSDYATLYINDTAVENKGTLDLTDLSEIKVRVVSEDGRFETEKTYKIKRS